MQVLLVILRNGNHFCKHKKHKHILEGKKRVNPGLNKRKHRLLGWTCASRRAGKPSSTSTYMKGHTSSWNLYLIMMLTKKLRNKKVNEKKTKIECTLYHHQKSPMFYLLENLRNANEQITERSSIRLEGKTARFFYALFGKMPGYVRCLCSMCLSLFLFLCIRLF